MTFIVAFFNAVPRWVWIALVAALGATSCKLTIDLGSVKLELEKSKVATARLETTLAQATASAAVQSATLSQQVVKAQNESRKREAVILADAAASSTALDGLRKSVGQYGLRAAATNLPVGSTALADSPFPELLLESTGRYVDLAATCDRHVNDIKTLMEAWPK